MTLKTAEEYLGITKTQDRQKKKRTGLKSAEAYLDMPETGPQEPRFVDPAIQDFIDETKEEEGYEGFNKSTLQAGGTIASGMVAAPVGGLAGLARLITTGSLEEAGKTLEGVTDVLTWKPETWNIIPSEEYKQSVEEFMSLMELMQAPGKGLAWTADQTAKWMGYEGAPAWLQATLASAPEAAAVLLPFIKGLKARGASKKLLDDIENVAAETPEKFLDPNFRKQLETKVITDPAYMIEYKPRPRVAPEVQPPGVKPIRAAGGEPPKLLPPGQGFELVPKVEQPRGQIPAPRTPVRPQDWLDPLERTRPWEDLPTPKLTDKQRIEALKPKQDTKPKNDFFEETPQQKLDRLAEKEKMTDQYSDEAIAAALEAEGMTPTPELIEQTRRGGKLATEKTAKDVPEGTKDPFVKADSPEAKAPGEPTKVEPIWDTTVKVEGKFTGLEDVPVDTHGTPIVTSANNTPVTARKAYTKLRNAKFRAVDKSGKTPIKEDGTIYKPKVKFDKNGNPKPNADFRALRDDPNITMQAEVSGKYFPVETWVKMLQRDARAAKGLPRAEIKVEHAGSKADDLRLAELNNDEIGVIHVGKAGSPVVRYHAADKFKRGVDSGIREFYADIKPERQFRMEDPATYWDNIDTIIETMERSKGRFGKVNDKKLDTAIKALEEFRGQGGDINAPRITNKLKKAGFDAIYYDVIAGEEGGTALAILNRKVLRRQPKKVELYQPEKPKVRRTRLHPEDRVPPQDLTQYKAYQNKMRENFYPLYKKKLNAAKRQYKDQYLDFEIEAVANRTWDNIIKNLDPRLVKRAIKGETDAIKIINGYMASSLNKGLSLSKLGRDIGNTKIRTEAIERQSGKGETFEIGEASTGPGSEKLVTRTPIKRKTPVAEGEKAPGPVKRISIEKYLNEKGELTIEPGRVFNAVAAAIQRLKGSYQNQIRTLSKTLSSKTKQFLADRPGATGVIDKLRRGTRQSLEWLGYGFIEDFRQPHIYKVLRAEANIKKQRWTNMARDVEELMKHFSEDIPEIRGKKFKPETIKKRIRQIAEGSVSEISKLEPVKNLAADMHDAWTRMYNKLKESEVLTNSQFEKLNRQELRKVNRQLEEYNKFIRETNSRIRKLAKEGKMTKTAAVSFGKRLMVIHKKRFELLNRLQTHYKNSGKNYFRTIRDQKQFAEQYAEMFNPQKIRKPFTKKRYDPNSIARKYMKYDPVKRLGEWLQNKELPVDLAWRKGIAQEAGALYQTRMYQEMLKHPDIVAPLTPKEMIARLKKSKGTQISKKELLEMETKAYWRKHGWELIDEEGFGPLAGRLVDKYVARDLKTAATKRNKVLYGYDWALNSWKKTKVIYNIPTVMRNVITNHILGDMANLNLLSPRTYKTYGSAIKDLKTGVTFIKKNKRRIDPLYREAADKDAFWFDQVRNHTDLFETGYEAGELRALNLMEDLMGRSTDAFDLLIRFAKNKNRKAIRAIFEKPQQFYGLTEKYSKLGVYKRKMKEIYKNKSYDQIRDQYIKAKQTINHNKMKTKRPSVDEIADAKNTLKEFQNASDQAWQFAEESIFNYGKVPPAIKWARRGYAPFITFVYKAVKHSSKTAINRPWKAIEYYALWQAMDYISEQFMGIDTSDAYKVMPEYMQEGGLPGKPSWVILPYKREDGRLTTLNVGYLMPWGQIKEGWGHSNIPSILMPNHPAVTLGVELYTQRDALFQDKLLPTRATASEKAITILDMAWKEIAPSWLSYSVSKLMKSDQLDKEGRVKYPLGYTLAEMFTGIKLKAYDPETEIYNRYYEALRERSDLRLEYAEEAEDIIYSNRSEASKEKAMNKLYRKYNKKYEEIEEEIIEKLYEKAD